MADINLKDIDGKLIAGWGFVVVSVLAFVRKITTPYVVKQLKAAMRSDFDRVHGQTLEVEARLTRRIDGMHQRLDRVEQAVATVANEFNEFRIEEFSRFKADVSYLLGKAQTSRERMQTDINDIKRRA